MVGEDAAEKPQRSRVVVYHEHRGLWVETGRVLRDVDGDLCHRVGALLVAERVDLLEIVERAQQVIVDLRHLEYCLDTGPEVLDIHRLDQEVVGP